MKIKKQKQNEKAITLIALVITIVVLLILAGVSINVFSENGIIKQAIKAREETQRSETIEKIKLAMLEIRTDKILDDSVWGLEQIEENIEVYLKNSELLGTYGNPVTKVYIKYKGENYYIDAQEEVYYFGDVEISEVPNLEIVQDKTSTGVEKVELSIVAEVELGKIKEIITPTGVLEGTKGRYTIEENGEYTFKVITNKNVEISKTIIIDNIKENGVDITSLVAGGETHQHIYESKYDSSYHWEECTICENIINKEAHEITTIGNASTCDEYVTLGSEVCSKNCGYSKKLQRLSHIRPSSDKIVWNDYKGMKHIAYQCERCGGYGNNAIQEAHIFNINGELLSATQILEKGIDVHSLGTKTCTICNIAVDLSKHNCYSCICGICQKNFGISLNFNISQNKIKNGKVQIDLVNNESQDVYYQYDSKGYTNTTNAIQSLYNKNYSFTTPQLVSKDGNIYTFKSTVSLKDRTVPITDEITANTYFYTSVKAGDVLEGYTMGSSIRGEASILIIPDAVAPVIQEVKATNIKEVDGWAISKKITITGTEKMNGMVYISMYYPDGKAVFEKQAVTINNEKYEFSIIPTIEAKDKTTFTIKVEDMFGNASTKTIDLEKIDGKAPELVTEIESNSEWKKSIKFNLEAIDDGIGNVQFAFNNQNDYKIGEYIDGKYKTQYNFTGDVYDKKIGILYIKDNLENIVTKKIELQKIDSTSPTITNVIKECVGNNVNIIIEANDINQKLLKEGSGISGYAITSTKETPSQNSFKSENKFVISKNGVYYVWVKDNAGNLSERYEIEI